jgi:hypothetical protein
MTNRSEQFRLFETHLAWLLKIQFPKLSQRANDSLTATQKLNAKTQLHHPAQK